MKKSESENMLNNHFFSPALHHCKNDTEINCALLNDTKKLNFKYQAATSHLIAFINENKNQNHNEAYFKETKRLAKIVLTTGTQIFEVYNAFDSMSENKSNKTQVFKDLHIKKKKLVSELYYYEIFSDEKKTTWKKHCDEATNISDTTLDSLIRLITAETNWYRLFMIRVKRLFTNLMPLIKSLNYQWFVHEINLINPLLSYVAWLFYVPRLSANLYSLFIHTVHGPWMNDKEKKIHFSAHLSMHWERLWFEILNDAVWLAVGLACCFFLSPANSILLTAALYFFDAGMSYTNHYFETQHHKELLNDLNSILLELNKMLDHLEDKDISEKKVMLDEVKEEIKLVTDYKKQTDLWIEYEQKKMNLSLFVTGMFSFSMSIGALPTLFTLSATLAIVCPLLSAAIVVGVCVTQYIKSRNIERHCPQSNILKLEGLDKHIEEHKARSDTSPLIEEASKHEEIKTGHTASRHILFSLKRSVSCPEDLRITVTPS